MCEIKLQTKQGSVIMWASYGENLFHVLQRNQIMIDSPCNGQGHCGKCKVVQISGELGSVKKECDDISKDSYGRGCCEGGRNDHGVRELLACQTIILGDAIIEGGQQNIQFQSTKEQRRTYEIVTEYEMGEDTHIEEKSNGGTVENEEIYGIAMDLGTTTIVMQLIKRQTHQVSLTYQSLNPQIQYGADVISRITAANKGAADDLHTIVMEKMRQGYEFLLQNTGISEHQVKQIVIAGNTTMLHFLRGYCVQGLGRYPFTPVSISYETVSWNKRMNEIIQGGGEAPDIILLPGNSAFVGADITAGLYGCGFSSSKDIGLLIDLGTNGEIAIGNRDRILATASAAGPAFEGGNLSCGVGSVPGAITQVIIKKNYTQYKTIGNRPPVGICGTGAIELVSELLKNHYIDKSGRLCDGYVQSGFEMKERIQTNQSLHFTQEDIRQLQLAKAAIRAGIEILIQEYQTSYEKIQTVYLAGGMGFHLDIRKAVHIGLIPKELAPKVVIVGNSSLGGCVKYLLHQNEREELEAMVSNTCTINLGSHLNFQDMFLKYMDF